MDNSLQLPESVQTLLRDRVHSVEDLEALLLLHSDRVRAWTVSDVASTLRIGEQLTTSALANLTQSGLCRSTPSTPQSVRFEARSPELANAVDELARVYATQRIEVLVFISQSAISRVRSNALRTFAGAFQISGRKKDG